MAVTNREKYLKGIASRVRKGALHFEGEDRPRVMMGGHEVFISSVSYDTERCDLVYEVSSKAGKPIASQNGERLLSGLPLDTLAAVDAAVTRYASLRRERERNIVNVESRLKAVAKVAKASPAL